MTPNPQLPLARVKDVVTQELPDEVLVYDLLTHKAHCLNHSAGLVWKHCDGETTVKDLAAIVARELGTAADEDVIWLALDELQKHNLLQERVVRTGRSQRLSRREAMKWALATAAAVPLVTSIAAPAAAQAASCVAESQGCKPNGNNEAGLCTASGQCCSCCCQPDEGGPANAHCTNNFNNCLPA